MSTRCTSLLRLPPGLRFPPRFENRVRYNSEKKRLEFDGYMSKADFDILCSLHNDIEYQRALLHLFQICVFEPTGSARETRIGFSYLTIGAAVVFTVILVLVLLRLWR